MAKMKNIPKNLWESYAMKKHPALLQVKERIRPLAAEPPKQVAPSYASMLAVARTECKAAVSQENVLQLIMEYLYLEGHTNVVEAIQEESNIKCKYYRY